MRTKVKWVKSLWRFPHSVPKRLIYVSLLFAVKAASPVWTFLGKGGMPDVAWPADYDTSAIGRHLGYVRRAGGHGLSAHDWTWLMDFADGVFRH